jgi:hypothetical protein
VLLAATLASCQGGASASASGHDDAAVTDAAAPFEDAPAAETPPAGVDPAAKWSFTPSNLALPLSAAGSAIDDLVISAEACAGASQVVFDTDAGAISICPALAGIRATNIAALDAAGAELAVFSARTMRIEAGMIVLVRGQRPLVLLATDGITINGVLRGSALGDQGFAGGAAGSPTGKGDGRGPGAGIGSAPGGGGGGSYCGPGGTGGANHTGAPGNAGGPVYGNERIIPLRGGSSGGNGGTWAAGAGGGAIQLIARHRIEIGRLGAISVGGGGGEREGAGGGSGGALLLEAPIVTIAGVLAANGGGGGSNGQFGEDAAADDQPAPGGMAFQLNTGEGGAGSAGTTLRGGDGRANPTFANGDYSGGGGGGAGYIRINATPDQLIVTGIVSPALGSVCASRGILPGS